MVPAAEWATYVAKRRASAKALRENSWIAFWIERLFRGLQCCSPASRLVGTETDRYLTAWLAAATVLVLITWRRHPELPVPLEAIVLGVAVFRVVDIMQSVVNLALFDRLGLAERSGGAQPVLDVTRSLVLLLWNFIELVIWFGLVYVVAPFQQCSVSFGSRFYFSAVTQLTIGYGDITPLGWAKAVAVGQGVLGWVVTVIVIARFVSSLPQFRSGAVVDGGAAQHGAAPDEPRR